MASACGLAARPTGWGTLERGRDQVLLLERPEGRLVCAARDLNARALSKLWRLAIITGTHSKRSLVRSTGVVQALRPPVPGADWICSDRHRYLAGRGLAADARASDAGAHRESLGQWPARIAKFVSFHQRTPVPREVFGPNDPGYGVRARRAGPARSPETIIEPPQLLPVRALAWPETRVAEATLLSKASNGPPLETPYP